MTAPNTGTQRMKALDSARQQPTTSQVLKPTNISSCEEQRAAIEGEKEPAHGK